MTEFLILKYAHILAFVYWLGGDLGTFFASRASVDDSQPPAARAVALKIMLACDQGPKLAMPLIFALGLHMAVLLGLLTLASVVLAAVWLITILWVVNVLVLYFQRGKPFTQKLAQIDLYFRIAVILSLLSYGLLGLAGISGIHADWVAWKIVIFASMVACGVMIRINLKHFIPAFQTMMVDGATPEGDGIMQQSLAACHKWVWAIWAGLFLNAALGVHLI